MKYLVAALSLVLVACSRSEPPPLQAEGSVLERIDLWSGRAPNGDGTFEEVEVRMTVHRPKQPNGTAVVICPGGGYAGLALQPEGHGIARWLNGYGVTGAVVEYRLPAGRHSVPRLDAHRALRTVRANAEKWNVNPERIGMLGFSAGGHLVSTAGTQFDAGDAQAADAIDRASSRPDFLILVYPVTTMGEHTHDGCKTKLLGADPPAELVERYSNELHVTAETPPAFLAHALDDEPVPPINSELFHKALQKHGVPTKYLELPSGGHGLDGYKGPMWDAWQTQSIAWLAERRMIALADASAKP